MRSVRLWQNCPQIEFGVEIDAAADNGILSICFPVDIDGKVVAGIPFGVEPRDDLGREPFRYESFCTGFPEGYYATRWTDVSSSERGYTFICPPGMHTGYAFKKSRRSLEFILHRFQLPAVDIARSAESIQGHGHHHWWCALVPHHGTWLEAASYRRAMEQHVPLLAWSPAFGLGRGGVPAPETPGKTPDRPLTDAVPAGAIRLGTSFSSAEVRPAGVVLSSMRLVRPKQAGKPAEYELRLYETIGRSADVVVRLARPAAKAVQTNFLGEPVTEAAKVSIAGREIRFPIQPWKIVTLRVVCGGGKSE